MRWLGSIAQLAISLLGWWRSGAEKRAERRVDETIEDGREAIIDRDADSVSRRIDRMRRKKGRVS